MPNPTSIGSSIVNTEQLDRILLRLKKKVKDLRGFYYDQVDPLITRFFVRQFDTQGAEGGERWEPLTSVTIALKSRRGHGLRGPATIGSDSDGMRRAFTHPGGLGFRRIDRDEYARGVIDDKAWRMQEGWKSTSIFGIPRVSPPVVNVPARPPVPREMPKSIIAEFERRLLREIERVGA